MQMALTSNAQSWKWKENQTPHPALPRKRGRVCWELLLPAGDRRRRDLAQVQLLVALVGDGHEEQRLLDLPVGAHGRFSGRGLDALQATEGLPEGVAAGRLGRQGLLYEQA